MASGGVVVSLLDVGFLLDFVLLDAKSYHARFVTLMATGTCSYSVLGVLELLERGYKYLNWGYKYSCP